MFEDQGQVGMTDKADIGSEMGKIDSGTDRLQQVLPNWIARAAVDQGDSFNLDPLRKGLQPIQVFRSDDLACPLDCIACFWIKYLMWNGSADRSVVVSDDAHQVGEFPQNADAFIRIWPVADDIAQAPNLVDAARIRKDRF